MPLSPRIALAVLLTTLAAVAVDASAGQVTVVQAQRADIQVSQTVVTTGMATTASMPMLPVPQSGSGLIMGQVIDAGTGRPVAGAVVSIGGGLPAGISGAMRIAAPSSSGPPPVPQLISDADGRFAFRNLPKGSFNLSASKPGLLDGAYGRFRPNGPTQSISLDDGERMGDVVVRMFHSAVITGTVVDASGEPVVGVQVRALRRSYVAGRRTVAAFGQTTQTDDRGMYRLSNLQPGEYIIAVPFVQASVPADFQLQGRMPTDLMSTMITPGNTTFGFSSGGTPVDADGRFLLQNSPGLAGPGVAPDATGALLVYPTSYYPSASTASSALPVGVRSGEERNGIDIALNLTPSSTISGRLVGPDGPAASYVLHLVPTETGELSADPDVATAITNTNGEFMFIGVPAGQYVIQTVRVPSPQPRSGPVTALFMSSDGGVNVSSDITVAMPPGAPPPPPPPSPPPSVGPAPPEEPTLWTATAVSVGGQDIRDMTITLNQGAKVSGRVDFEGSAKRPTPDQLATIPVVVEPADGRQRQTSMPARVDRSGQFSTQGLLPGKYLLRVGGSPPGWTLKSAAIGGVDVSETPFTVEGNNVGGVIVTFTDRISSLHGVVRMAQGQSGSPEGAGVIVFPADNRSWMDYGINPRRMKTARASKTGAYQFGQLPPGDYYVIAISEEFLGDWQDPRFLETLSRDAERVTIGDSDAHTQDLTVRDVRPAGGAPDPSDRLTASAFQPGIAAYGSLSNPVDEGIGEGHGPFVPDSDGEPLAQQRDTRVRPATGTASISGTVTIDDGGNTPARRARVTVRNTEAQLERSIMTDDAGRFSIGSLPPGHYSLSATKPAYVAVYYGAKHAGRVGTPISLEAGQQANGLDMRISRGGVITGRVIDDFGVPVPDVAVRLMQPRFSGGERTLSIVPSTGPSQTDDTGTYRIYGLPPGTYVVQVNPPFGRRLTNQETLQVSASELQRAATELQQAASQGSLGGQAPAGGAGASGQAGMRSVQPADIQPMTGQAVGFAPVYYPGTTSAADAGTVTVAAGQELSGVDLPMRLVPMARVEGTIVGPDGRPAPNVQVRLLPGDQNNLMAQISNLLLRTTPDGKFQATNIAPGHYTLSARSTTGEQMVTIGEPGGGQGVFVMRQAVPVAGRAGGPPPPPQGPPPVSLWAEQDLDVNGADINGLSLTLQEGMKISGRIAFDGRSIAPPGDFSRVRVSLQPAGAGRVAVNLPSAQVDENGAFTFTGVPPGEYRLFSAILGSGGPAGTGWTLRSAVVDGRDTLDHPLAITPGRDVQNAVITFTDRPSELSGRLIDAAGKPVSGLTILVFTTDQSLWTTASRRVRPPMQPATDGSFRATGLAAGEYYLAAVTDLEPGDWGDPAFMDQVAAAAIKITIAEGEKKVQDIRIAGGSPDPRR
jgi:protocatechuate 3,4-dioxygenase beta subunit